jgi:pimeloyl-ACP methyl ester carboxylesterase
MRRLVAAAAAVDVLAGRLAAAAPAVAGVLAPRTVKALTWGKCAETDLQQAGAQCAMMTVPLNYSDPQGPTIQIAVSRIRHTSSAARYQGVILTNPGGPGGGGLDLNVFLLQVLQAEGSAADKAAIADYDWIGFDPRGVGSSVPALTCAPFYFSGDRENYNPRTEQILHYWLSRSARYDQKCETHSAAQAALLTNMTTVDTVMDMDSIRQALGQHRITYYGFSYGTYLGQVYSTLFPSRVRRLVMDSNVDPRHVWYQANLNQDIAFNRNIKIWFGWLAQHHSFFHVGQTEHAVESRFYQEKARLFNHPIRGLVGPDEWLDAFLLPAYYQQTWVDWGEAFANWAHTHGRKAGNAIVTLYREVDTPGDDNAFAVYNAVQCTDVQWPTSWAVWSRDNHRINRIAPFATWLNAWYNAPCLDWPAPASRQTPMQIDGTGISNALLIDETLDAATPFGGSLEVRRLFPHSVLLAEPGGTSHANSLAGNLCVDNTIARYLADGTLPTRKPHAKWDKTCKPLPRPVPPAQASTNDPASAILPLAPQLHGVQP